MTTCYGYVRVSTLRQGEGVSLDAQKDVIEQYADRRDLQIIGWYEETVTASKTGRPEFNKMVKNLKRGRARGFIVHKIDRSARNYTDWGEVHKLADAGIEIHVATENLDFGTRGGRLSADIQAVFAADYSRNLSDEVRKGQQKQIDMGLYPFPAPLGYLSQGKAELKIPDPAQAPFIKQAFNLYASGEYSLRSLQKEMQRRGFRSRKGRVVSRSSLEKILENPFYCGTVRLRTTGVTYQGKHKKLISASLFEKVQQIKSGKVGKKVTKHNHTFRGLFHCAHCGGLLTGELQKNRVYYRCHQIGCPAKSVREDRLDMLILDMLEAYKLTPEKADWLVDEIKRQSGSRPQDEEVRALTFRIDQISARLERLTNAFLDELIDRETFQSQRDKLTHEREALRENLDDLSQNRISDAMIDKFFERVKNVVLNYRFGKPGLKREITIWATSNRTMDDQNPSIEPQNWLREANLAAGGLTCGDARANFRTLLDEIARLR
ncbi:MAG: recombinase family protein [Erythrobacter sp.]|uniref:recombinase family protein n=1 Tax=Erythrobacter sp. TaxID=1042 RepID=UPI002611F121|nr:recombinase family protein [Erythrobacter sp.]MDJ0977249.1 recombinase family protein [Erythrobacter sp.]